MASLPATVKLVALFASLGAAISIGLLFGLNYKNIADRYSVWYMRRRERSVWYRWINRPVTPLGVRFSGIGLALYCAILSAAFVGALYPSALRLALILMAVFGFLVLVTMIVFAVVDARQHPPKSPTARLVGNAFYGLVFIFVGWIVFSIVQQCLSASGCR